MLYIRRSWHFLSFMSIMSTDIFPKSTSEYSVHVLVPESYSFTMSIFAYLLAERNNQRREKCAVKRLVHNAE